jgi:hypothetical protein
MIQNSYSHGSIPRKKAFPFSRPKRGLSYLSVTEKMTSMSGSLFIGLIASLHQAYVTMSSVVIDLRDIGILVE